VLGQREIELPVPLKRPPVLIRRSVRCSLKFSNTGKLNTLSKVLAEYGKVVNTFTDCFWDNGCPKKSELLKPIVDLPDSWLSARLRKVAAREAIDLVSSVRNRKGKPGGKPSHSGKSMNVSSTIASLDLSDSAPSFDAWVSLRSIGNKVRLDLPVRLHKHFHKWADAGERLESYVITRDSVQFCFEVETGPKKDPTSCIGVDTGIKALASVSTGDQYGQDIESIIDRVHRCEHGSKGQRRASNTLRQRMSEVAKEVTSEATLVVVENLKGITNKPKRRLGKSMRRSIGRWNVGYWRQRLEMTCQERNVSFRTVSPYQTSITCSSCGHIDRKNRQGEVFRCLTCGHEDNADVQASRNILTRFLTGPYGAGCKPLIVSQKDIT